MPSAEDLEKVEEQNGEAKSAFAESAKLGKIERFVGDKRMFAQ